MKVTSPRVVDGGLVVVLDVNMDKWPDLFIVPNRLLLNNKNGSFDNVTSVPGIRYSGGLVKSTRITCSFALTADFSGPDGRPDGWPDVYIVYTNPGFSNYVGHNQLLVNNWKKNGSFVEVTSGPGLDHMVHCAGGCRSSGSNGAIAADFNQDGAPDLFVVRRSRAPPRPPSCVDLKKSKYNRFRVVMSCSSSSFLV